jgi:Right handed beta helix region
VPDDCDILNSTHQDCNENGIPDVCDLAQGTSRDCNGNGVPDECDLHSGERPDLNGNGILDECEPKTTWWVDAAAPAAGNGSAGSPFQTIAQAMIVAISGDEILLRDGIYSGSGNRDVLFDGRSVVVRSEHGPATCILDLQEQGRAFSLGYGVGESARIEGLTFRNGRDGGDGGGAIKILGSSPMIQNCVFESCLSPAKGGAIRLDNSGAQIRDCLFRGNSTWLSYADFNQGGAIYFRGDMNTLAWPPDFKRPPLATILRCHFEGNESMDGGAIQSDEALPLSISHCTFFGNVARDSGGAIANAGWTYWGGGGKVDDCLFVGNRAGVRGGAIWVSAVGEYSWMYYVQALVTGSTFVANLAGAEGGALSAEGASTTRMENCIAWENSAPHGSQIAMVDKPYSFGPPVLSVDQCDVQGGEAGVYKPGSVLTWGAGNLDVDPQFVDPDGPDNDPLTFLDNDYRPIAGSPVNDAGDNALVPSDLNDVDSDGNTRESTPLDLDLTRRFVEDLLAPNVGAGIPPLVDMGCYERH